jgi:hypothetical protein
MLNTLATIAGDTCFARNRAETEHERSKLTALLRELTSQIATERQRISEGLMPTPAPL